MLWDDTRATASRHQNYKRDVMRSFALWAVILVPAILSVPEPARATPLGVGTVKLRHLQWADDDHLMITTSTIGMPLGPEKPPAGGWWTGSEIFAMDSRRGGGE